MCHGHALPAARVPSTTARTAPVDRGTLHLRGGVLPDGVERDVFVAGGRITFQ